MSKLTPPKCFCGGKLDSNGRCEWGLDCEFDFERQYPPGASNQNVQKETKSRIAEIEAMLDKEDSSIEILPNGKIQSRNGPDMKNDSDPKPITMRENLGAEYSHSERL